MKPLESGATRSVTFGYLDGFHHGDPAIVILGDHDGLARLARVLRQLATNAPPAHVALHELDFLASCRGTQITLELQARAEGMKQVNGSRDFFWRLSAAEAHRFADMIDVVAAAAGPGHNYLEVDTSDDDDVVVSRGEYSDDIFSL